MLLDLFSGKNLQPAECIVRIDGEEIAHLYQYLTEVKAKTTRVDGANATLTFATRRKEDGTWIVQDDPLIHPWAEFELLAKFGDTEEEVMRGYIKQATCQYPSDAGTTTVILECQDASLLLDRSHRRRVWGAESPTDDLAIIEEILSGTGISIHDDSVGEAEIVLNQNTTDIRFLRRRAQSIGHELIFREGELYFGPMRLDADSPQSTILVYAGTDTTCINFSLVEDGHLPDQVIYNVAAESEQQGEESVVEPNLTLLGNEAATSSDSGLTDFAWRLDREGESNQTDLAVIAQAKANENSMKIKVTGELDGSLYGHVLRVGEPVGVDGVGDRHNGIYYVDKVDHVFDGSGYRQSFELLRNAYGDNLESGPPNPLASL